MNTIVIEHVALDELPAAWQAGVAATSTTRVTVRIEEEIEQGEASELSKNPLFGLWQDREEMKGVASYARQLRVSNTL